MEVASGRVRSVTAGGERFEVGKVVNAAGPWAKPVAKMAGIDLPVDPVRRQYFITKPLEWVPDTFPLLIDWGTGVYMHQESGGMLVGESDLAEPPSFHQQVDWDFLATVSEHAVARVPKLQEAEVSTGVAGLYEISPDHNAILGAVPGVENFFCANGFSGHGMQHAPAVGLVIAELLTEGAARSVDLSPYDFTRFSRPSAGEYNVI
jgi:sarcosine oxidase subunit beta